jgi:hypothetical protein
LSDVVAVLVEYRANIGSGGAQDDEEEKGADGDGDGDQTMEEGQEAPVVVLDDAELQAREQRSILSHLIAYLRSVA